MRVLEAELGIGQASLYNAFGSKHELLRRCVDRYLDAFVNIRSKEMILFGFVELARQMKRVCCAITVTKTRIMRVTTSPFTMHRREDVAIVEIRMRGIREAFVRCMGRRQIQQIQPCLEILLSEFEVLFLLRLIGWYNV